jgi:hypothetical protein
MSSSLNNDWFFQFNNICVLDGPTIEILKNEKEFKNTFAKLSRLTDNDINKHITKPLSNFAEHFAKINQFNPGMPVFINGEDITLFFMNYFYKYNIDIWNTFFIDNNGMPERCIETLICRVPLDIQTYLPYRECNRYSLLYCIFRFHYSNIYFIDQYLTVLKNSILTKNEFKSNELYNDYVELLYKTAMDIIEKHKDILKINHININYHDVYDDIVMLYQIVCMMEKLIYGIVSDIKLCEFELTQSIKYFDPVVYNKHKRKYISNLNMSEIINKNKDCTSFFINKLKKITQHILESIKENKLCSVTFEFQ